MWHACELIFFFWFVFLFVARGNNKHKNIHMNSISIQLNIYSDSETPKHLHSGPLIKLWAQKYKHEHWFVILRLSGSQVINNNVSFFHCFCFIISFFFFIITSVPSEKQGKQSKDIEFRKRPLLQFIAWPWLSLWLWLCIMRCNK